MSPQDQQPRVEVWKYLIETLEVTSHLDRLAYLDLVAAVELFLDH